jgi:tRNA(Ile)-lysidine synthase
MQLLQKFIGFIKKENLFQPKDKLLLAVSGGVDSVVLCELCRQAGYDFVIAHCNFQLRGEESERDEQFVRGLAKKYGVDVFVKKFDTEKYSVEKKVGIQEAARNLRYEWFYGIVNGEWSILNGESSIVNGDSEFIEAPIHDSQLTIHDQKGTTHHSPLTTHILTAHHANDNIETLLMNFFKGTGINGLRAIQPKQGMIVHALLFAKKDELLEFAKQNDLQYVEDSSNASDKYTRNFFRNQLIPSVQKVFPQVEDNLLDNIDRFRDIEMLYRQSIDLHKKSLVEKKGNEIHLPVLKLLKAQPLHTIVYEIIKDFGFNSRQVDDVIRLLNSEAGKYVQSASHRVINNRKWLIISPNNTEEANNILIEEDDKEIQFPGGTLKFEKLPTTNLPTGQADHKLQTQSDRAIRAGTNPIASFNASQIKYPLLLRKWKQGDYFYPLGMNKKKKLNRFFIDQKLSLTQKENTWILEMDKKIIWVVGMRIDDRFKITESTKNILKISQC